MTPPVTAMPPPDPERPSDRSAWLTLLLAICLVTVTGLLAHHWITDHGGDGANDDPRHRYAGLAVLATAAAGVLTVVIAARTIRAHQRQLASQLQQQSSEIERRSADVLQQQRIADLGLLAAGIAHELGQPLSAARVDIEGLHLLRQLGKDPDPQQVSRVLTRVGSCVLAMSQTVAHLRDLAISDGLQQEDLDLASLVTATLADQDRWSRFASSTIHWEPPAQPLLVRGDPLGIRLILINLLRNALEAVADQDPAHRQVRVVAGPGPQVAVHDTGPGIRAEDLERVFDPFVSGKGRGRGIGLSLAQASARRMGASLSVRSVLGSGTIFTLTLSAIEPTQPAGSLLDRSGSP